MSFQSIFLSLQQPSSFKSFHRDFTPILLATNPVTERDFKISNDEKLQRQFWTKNKIPNFK